MSTWSSAWAVAVVVHGDEGLWDSIAAAFHALVEGAQPLADAASSASEAERPWERRHLSLAARAVGRDAVQRAVAMTAGDWKFHFKVAGGVEIMAPNADIASKWWSHPAMHLRIATGEPGQSFTMRAGNHYWNAPRGPYARPCPPSPQLPTTCVPQSCAHGSTRLSTKGSSGSSCSCPSTALRLNPFHPPSRSLGMAAREMGQALWLPVRQGEGNARLRPRFSSVCAQSCPASAGSWTPLGGTLIGF